MKSLFSFGSKATASTKQDTPCYRELAFDMMQKVQAAKDRVKRNLQDLDDETAALDIMVDEDIRVTEALSEMVKGKEPTQSNGTTSKESAAVSEPVKEMEHALRKLRKIYDENGTLGMNPRQSEVKSHSLAHQTIKHMALQTFPTLFVAVENANKTLVAQLEQSKTQTLELQRVVKEHLLRIQQLEKEKAHALFQMETSSSRSVGPKGILTLVILEIDGIHEIGRAAGQNGFDGLIVAVREQARRAAKELYGFESGIRRHAGSMMFVFQKALNALNFALQVNESVSQIPLPEIAKGLTCCARICDSEGNVVLSGPRVKCVLHTGTFLRVEEHTATDYCGGLVRAANALLLQCNGGEILVSSEWKGNLLKQSDDLSDNVVELDVGVLGKSLPKAWSIQLTKNKSRFEHFVHGAQQEPVLETTTNPSNASKEPTVLKENFMESTGIIPLDDVLKPVGPTVSPGRARIVAIIDPPQENIKKPEFREEETQTEEAVKVDVSTKRKSEVRRKKSLDREKKSLHDDKGIPMNSHPVDATSSILASEIRNLSSEFFLLLKNKLCLQHYVVPDPPVVNEINSDLMYVADNLRLFVQLFAAERVLLRQKLKAMFSKVRMLVRLSKIFRSGQPPVFENVAASLGQQTSSQIEQLRKEMYVNFTDSREHNDLLIRKNVAKSFRIEKKFSNTKLISVMDADVSAPKNDTVERPFSATQSFRAQAAPPPIRPPSPSGLFPVFSKQEVEFQAEVEGSKSSFLMFAEQAKATKAENDLDGSRTLNRSLPLLTSLNNDGSLASPSRIVHHVQREVNDYDNGIKFPENLSPSSSERMITFLLNSRNTSPKKSNDYAENVRKTFVLSNTARNYEFVGRPPSQGQCLPPQSQFHQNLWLGSTVQKNGGNRAQSPTESLPTDFLGVKGTGLPPLAPDRRGASPPKTNMLNELKALTTQPEDSTTTTLRIGAYDSGAVINTCEIAQVIHSRPVSVIGMRPLVKKTSPKRVKPVLSLLVPQRNTAVTSENSTTTTGAHYVVTDAEPNRAITRASLMNGAYSGPSQNVFDKRRLQRLRTPVREPCKMSVAGKTMSK